MILKVPSYFDSKEDCKLFLEEPEVEECCNKKCQDASGCAPGVNNWTRTLGIIMAG